MRKLLGITAIISLINLTVHAQGTALTRIHIFNATTPLGYILIKTTANDTNPIKIKSVSWATIQMTSDSLGFVVNDKPYFAHFEAGKQYYFVAESTHNSRIVFTEKSEREFLLSVHVNPTKGPDVYNLDKVPN